MKKLLFSTWLSICPFQAVQAIDLLGAVKSLTPIGHIESMVNAAKDPKNAINTEFEKRVNIATAVPKVVIQHTQGQVERTRDVVDSVKSGDPKKLIEGEARRHESRHAAADELKNKVRQAALQAIPRPIIPITTMDKGYSYFGDRNNPKVPGYLFMETALDSTMTKEERKHIHEAMKVFMNRAFKPEVIECAYRNSDQENGHPLYNDYSIDEFTKRLAETLKDSKDSYQHVKLNIEGFDFPLLEGATGWACPIHPGEPNELLRLPSELIKKFHSGPPSFLRRGGPFTIHLNTQYLGKGHGGKEPLSTNEAAGLIGHELLHSMGFFHSLPYDNAQSFVTTYEECIEGNGVHRRDP